jgi:hypothetical protein
MIAASVFVPQASTVRLPPTLTLYPGEDILTTTCCGLSKANHNRLWSEVNMGL